MKPMVKFYDGVVVALAVLSGIAILLAMTLVVIDVLGRYFLSLPLAWVNEWTEHLIVFIPFFGMAWLVRRLGGHVRIDLVVNALAPRTQNLLSVWVALLCAGTCAFVAYYAGLESWKNYVRGVQTIGNFPVPKYPLIAAVCLGMGLCAIEFLRLARESYRRLSKE